MARYDGLKHPFSHRLGQWANRKTNDSQESQAKSIPCHVTKTDKDFVYVQFDTNNNIFTMPTVKMTQGFSRFGREPTQKGDKGYAVPGNYYMGGIDAYAGGKTNFYPRGNLSTLSFQPVANMKAPSRDYDQHHETGGPSGWIVKTMEDQQQSQQGSQTSGGSGSTGTGSGGGGTTSLAVMRAHQRIMQQRHFMQVPTLTDATSGSSGSGSGNGSSGSGSGQQQDKTQFSFDKNGLATIQSKDTMHLITVDQQGKKITLQVPTGENVYVGGDGQTGSYAQLVTTKGPVINAKGRYA
jgi:hypothetical protein